MHRTSQWQAFNSHYWTSLCSAWTVALQDPSGFPEAHLVGVGAVGSAAVYALAHLDDVEGTLHLIDNEKIEDPNLNRYVLARRRDIGAWKVDRRSSGSSQFSDYGRAL